MRHGARLDRLRRRVDARRGRMDAHAIFERERLESMSDAQVLRSIAAMTHHWSDGPPDNPFIENFRMADVDALIDAGDYESVIGFLQPHIDELRMRCNDETRT